MIRLRRSRKARLVSRFGIEAPRPSPERHGVAIVVIAKNEAAYIRDWLAFHSLAGVREFVLYDNGSTDATTKIASSVPGVAATVIPWQLKTSTNRKKLDLHCQVMAYCHAICTFGQRFRWMAFIDIDEFIVPRFHNTIPEALGTVAEFSNVSLPWSMFGHCGNIDMPEEAVPFVYDRCARDARAELLNFKCIVDPCTVTQVGVHKFLTDQMGNRTSNMLGKAVPYKRRNRSGFVTKEIVQLNHYFLKSRAETEEKIRAGSVSGIDPVRREARIRKMARLIEADTIEDNAAISFLARHGIGSSEEFRGRFDG